jgi:hypothetical protein
MLILIFFGCIAVSIFAGVEVIFNLIKLVWLLIRLFFSLINLVKVYAETRHAISR